MPRNRKNKGKSKDKPDGVSPSSSPIVQLKPFPNKERGVLEQRGKKSVVILPSTPLVFSSSSYSNHLINEVTKNNVGGASSTNGNDVPGPSHQQERRLEKPLNFRGGFNLPGRNRLDSQRMSESSETYSMSSQGIVNQPSQAQSIIKPSSSQSQSQKERRKDSPQKKNPVGNIGTKMPPAPHPPQTPKKIRQGNVNQNQHQQPQPSVKLSVQNQGQSGQTQVNKGTRGENIWQKKNSTTSTPPFTAKIPQSAQQQQQQKKIQILQRPSSGEKLQQRPPTSGPIHQPQINNQVLYAQQHAKPPQFNAWTQRHPPPQAYISTSYIPTPSSNMMQTHQVVYPPPSLPVEIPLIPSTFTCQLPRMVAHNLSNPLLPMSKNPYNFSVNHSPPFPYYFDLFQKLPLDDFKPNKSGLYREFCDLPLDHQLEHFFTALGLPFSELLLRWQVILDILIILREHYPRCELYAFGSIITGLGDFGSDIDIYVDLIGESTLPGPVDPRNKIPSHEAVDNVKRILRRSRCPHNKGAFVKNLIPVKSARVPILKLIHRATDINCDLSFENRLSVRNTQMLDFYMKLDPNMHIFRFMVLIRYWAKFHHLTGSNHIKNYALALLVLVYLCKRGIVPPLVLQQQLKQVERQRQNLKWNPDEIDGWDSSFCNNLASSISAGFKPCPLPGSEGPNPTLAKILIRMAVEFFDMYANLDFSKFVVCTLLGDFLPKHLFEPGNEEDLPDSLERYKNWAVKQEMNRRLNINTCFCVQDPFVLSFNVGCVTPVGTLLKFQLACAKTKHTLTTKDLGSLLDVLTPLPEHIGEKKFMKILKSDQMADDLMCEIKSSIGVPIKSEENKKLQQQQNHPSIKLPFPIPGHLRKFERLIDEKSMRAALKRGKWETFIDFALSSEFESLFVTELFRCGIRESRRISAMDITIALCERWKEFAIDFLKAFFEFGLKLTVKARRNFWSDQTKPMSPGRRQRWRIRSLTKKEEEMISPSDKDPAEQYALHNQIKDPAVTSCKILYEIWTIEVPYPFWDKRPTHTVEAGKEMRENGSIIQIPMIPSPKEIQKTEKEKRRKKGKAKEDVQEEKQIPLKTCFDPTELERRTSEHLLRRLEKQKGQGSVSPFSRFQFNLLVKLDVSSTSEKPQIIFMFEKDPSMKKTASEYQRAMTTLSSILLDSFPAYQLFRLVKWLDVKASSETSSLPAIPNVNPDEVTENGNADSQKKENDIGEKKKKVKSKLEEDLLIPSSSSSSSCSSSPDLNDVADEDADEGEAHVISEGEDAEESEGEVKKNEVMKNKKQINTTEKNETDGKSLSEVTNQEIKNKEKAKSEMKINSKENVGDENKEVDQKQRDASANPNNNDVKDDELNETSIREET